MYGPSMVLYKVGVQSLAIFLKKLGWLGSTRLEQNLGVSGFYTCCHHRFSYVQVKTTSILIIIWVF